MDRKPKTEKEQLDFYLKFREAWPLAAERSGVVSRFYKLAGKTVCIRFAGKALTNSLCPALEHLETGVTGTPDLTIMAWDTASTGVKAPPPPCSRRDFTDRGDIWGFNSKRIRTAFHYSDFSVNLLNMEQDEGLYWVNDTSNFPYWVYSSPFRTLFHWWLQKHGHQLVHAAAVGFQEGAVLITGKGGSGKSSTALRCLEDGWLYLGDDYVVVTKDPEPRVHSLYCTAKLSAGDMARFPGLSSLPMADFHVNPEKETVFLYPERSDQIIRTLPLIAILTPGITNCNSPHLLPASFWQVHRSMSFTTVAQLPGAGRETHEYIGDLVEGLPCYTLQLGNTREEVPAIVRKALDTTVAPGPASEDSGRAMATPLISVIMPVFNGEKFIERAVGNILSQNYPAIELIVVDDESTDRSAEIIQSLDTDLRYFRQTNKGPGAARNRGILNASGDIIAFLDVDDYWPPNNLSLLIGELLQNPALDVVRGHAQLVRESEGGETEFLGSPHESFPNYIGAGVYRKRVFAKVGMYDASLRFGEDNDWFNRAREAGIHMKRLDEVTLFVRRHGGNMTEGKDLVELNTLQVFKKFLERKRAAGNSKH
jgi:hypothetical protein